MAHIDFMTNGFFPVSPATSFKPIRARPTTKNLFKAYFNHIWLRIFERIFFLIFLKDSAENIGEYQKKYGENNEIQRQKFSSNKTKNWRDLVLETVLKIGVDFTNLAY